MLSKKAVSKSDDFSNIHKPVNKAGTSVPALFFKKILIEKQISGEKNIKNNCILLTETCVLDIIGTFLVKINTKTREKKSEH